MNPPPAMTRGSVHASRQCVGPAVPPAADAERQRPCVQIDGRDEAAPSQKVGHGGQPHDECARGAGEEVRSQGAGEVAEREHERLREEEPEHDLGGLELHRKKREHAAPYARGVDGQEQAVAERGDVRLHDADDGGCVQRSSPETARICGFSVPAHCSRCISITVLSEVSCDALPKVLSCDLGKR